MQHVAKHAINQIAKSIVATEPFPHLVVDDIFPVEFFDEIRRNLPSVGAVDIDGRYGHVLIEEGDASFERFDSAQRAFWLRFDNELKNPICRGLITKLVNFSYDKVAQLFKSAGQLSLAKASDGFRSQRGIIQCRTQGAVQLPHIDKATTAFTYLFYFSADQALRPFGTTLFDVARKDELADAYRKRADVRVWYPDPDEFGITPNKTVEFRGNRLVAFVNFAHSAHGVSTKAGTPRFTMQNYCELPESAALDLFRGWKDALSPTGLYAGGL